MSSKIIKSELEDQLKQIISRIKETYFQLLSSLKFQNSYQKKQFKITSAQPNKQKNNMENQHQIQQEEDQFPQHEISQIQNKKFKFQEELAMQNKGYMNFINLLDNLKQLQAYNQYLRSLVSQSDEQAYLSGKQELLIEQLKLLQLKLPQLYYTQRK